MKTLSIDEAARQLDSLAELALQGESILIAKGSRWLVLQEIPAIPIAPPGFFDEVYDEEYIREDNFLATRSVVTPDP